MNISGKCTFSFHGYLCSQKCIFYTFQSTWEPINLCFTSFTLCLQCAHDLAPDYGCVSAFFCFYTNLDFTPTAPTETLGEQMTR